MMILSNHPLNPLLQQWRSKTVFEWRRLRSISMLVYLLILRSEAKSLLMIPKLVQAYQNTTLFSREFKLRLLEMVATAFHNTAALLLRNMEHEFYQDPRTRMPISERSRTPVIPPDRWPPTHRCFILNTETTFNTRKASPIWSGTGPRPKNFGGVVLFDRGLSGAKVCWSVFLGLFH